MSVAFDTIGHPTNLGGELWEKKRMSSILSELTSLVDEKKRTDDATKRGLIRVESLTIIINKNERSLTKFKNDAENMKKTAFESYQRRLLKIDSTTARKIQTLQDLIEENKTEVDDIKYNIDVLTGGVGSVSRVSAVEPASDTTEAKPRQKYVRFQSQLTTQMIKNIIIELVNNEEKGAIKIKVVMTQLEKRHGNIITHEERTGGSNSRLYGRVYAILGKMRKDGELYKGTGDGIVVRKVSSLETLTETA